MRRSASTSMLADLGTHPAKAAELGIDTQVAV